MKIWNLYRQILYKSTLYGKPNENHSKYENDGMCLNVPLYELGRCDIHMLSCGSHNSLQNH